MVSLAQEIRSISTVRNPRNSNWDVYDRFVNLGMDPLTHSDSVLELEATAAVFTKVTVEAFKKACTKRVSRGGHKPSWWNQDLDRLRII